MRFAAILLPAAIESTSGSVLAACCCRRKPIGRSEGKEQPINRENAGRQDFNRIAIVPKSLAKKTCNDSFKALPGVSARVD